MRLRSAAICLCLILILGCAKGTSVTATRLAVGDKAPSFTLGDIFGGPMTNSAKIVHSSNATVIVIWSMACPDCREALMDVQAAYEEYGSKAIGFIGVNFDQENVQGVKAFLKGEGIDFLTLWDRASQVTRAYKALDYTFSIFVADRRGRLVLVQYDHPPDLAVILAGKLDEILSNL
jgi:peroxiredoxin